jgi:AbrB family looped-hinge helix DNA binding protein
VEVSLDKKGRVTIPKEHREALGLEEEDRLALRLERGELRLRPVTREQLKVRAHRKWGHEAFPSSREATFADE